VDTLVVTGCTTSGCVRATVVDGQSYNFRMIVPEEAVFDRGEASHAMSLWDMNAKYADVVSVQETLDYLRRLP
jgi:maleamate amidohydrolase